MAHFEAKKSSGTRKCMVLEFSPYNKIQAHPHIPLEFNPTQNDLAHLLNFYLLSCKVEGKSPATIDTYCRRLSRFVAFASQSKRPLDVGEITSNHIRAFLLFLREGGTAENTLNAYYRTLHTFFGWMIGEGVISSHPMANIKPPRLKCTVMQPFSLEDIENMLLLCSTKKFLDVRNKAIILLLLDTGLRLSEAANLEIADVNFSSETVKVMGKGAKERLVRIGRLTQKALLQYLLLRRDNFPCLWVSEERRPLCRHGLQIAIVRLCHRAGVIDAKPGPHTFRHTAAIQCLRNGMGEFALQMMLGHSTLTMTRRYVSSLNHEDVFKAHRIASPVDNMGLK